MNHGLVDYFAHEPEPRSLGLIGPIGRIGPMDPVFLLNSRHSAHVGLWLRPDLGCFGEEVFKSRWSDIDENADWLIRTIFETVDRAAGGINAVARKQVGPGTVQ